MKTKNIAIVDYGMGNLRSVQNAIHHVGGESEIVSDPELLSTFDKVILPGVGAFGQAISCLEETGLIGALNERRAAGAHILGICLGMQLMCAVSEEEGEHQGLDWFDARVIQFVPTQKLSVPHMGWNEVEFTREDPVLNGVLSRSDAYFVHSYHVYCDDPADVLAKTEYDISFASMIQKDNVRGIQFHPEKSQEFGLTIIRNYLEL